MNRIIAPPSRCVSGLLLFLLPFAMPAQQAVPLASSRLTIQLEQLKQDKATPVRPEHVFEHNDVVRFRINTSSSGYLYVVNDGTSGQYTVLFPATTANNAISRGTSFFVPASEDGWFQIDGPPGFETVYFLVSPTPLNVSTTSTLTKPKAFITPKSSLMPRCNDSVFQARGECVDTSAGASVLPRDAPLPPQITAAAPRASRDLVLAQDSDGTVNVTQTGAGPAVYVFRLAHK